MADKQMPWYRMYTEARNDAKLRALTKPQHYIWFNLLCLSAEQDERGAIIGYDDELLAVEVADGDEALLKETIERLIKLRILARVDDGICFLNFLDRQYDRPSDMPEETRKRQQASRARRQQERDSSPSEQNQETMSRDVTRCHANVMPVSRHVTQREEGDAEGDADLETEYQPPASSFPEDEQQRRQQRAQARTHTRESQPAEADVAAATGTSEDDVLMGDVAVSETMPATATRRQPLAAFKRQFADAAGLSPGERGQELDAIIAAYRPRAPDAELIIEANSCRTFYGGKRAKRMVDCRLLANWLARWADQRAERQRQQQHSRGETADGDERRSAAAGASGRNGRRPVDLPDPTRNGQWAHMVQTFPDDE